MLHQNNLTKNSSLIHQGYYPDQYITRFEKLPVTIHPNSNEASLAIATEIATLIRQRQQEGKNCVLGLATGSSPIKVYEELVRMHLEDGLSFSNVITFNLDEYYPAHPDSLQSYNRFMREYLFNFIDILPENVHIPDGTIPKEKLIEYCRNYDGMIEASGGIDIQLLGIGRTGHIGFNEPGSHINSPTRIITLDHLTRTDASGDFFGEENVPRMAITMGVGSIMKAKKIILIAWGEGKAPIIRKALEGPVTDSVPTTYLQNHPNTQVILDVAASAELTRIKTPWLVSSCQWDDRLVRKAVVWLCQKQEKPILKLTDRDYNDNGMSDLVAEQGPSNKINIKVFNDLQHTITGWPGGKPNADDSTRPERALPYPKRVIVFSPHPDDDVISMGGTLARLVEQGHIVHTAYQTSGNIAVFDDDVLRFLDFTREYKQIFKLEIMDAEKIFRNVRDFFLNKKPGEVDTEEIRQIKTAIRRGEAKAAARFVGVPEERVHFLDMPFYETGEVKKKPLSEEDIQIIVDLLNEIRPQQIYAAGDLSDPHGTHRVCMNAILEALNRLKDEDWFKECRVWLYRGAWQEWDLDQAEMAVPLSPEEVHIKRNAIFKHQSQKDRPLFPGADSREFWQRAEDRNHDTAVLYDKMGMAEYEAIEVFVRYHP
jgi:glucosamine-6-phosphate deaminase